MPKRNDIKHILIIGSGPIVIGQACEFDYAGTQACKALKEEGYKITLINSNPATVMTDLQMADTTYIEPLTVEFVTSIIALEKPDALLPTMGGQTALNLALELDKKGVLAAYGVELLGATPQAIMTAEDRHLFRKIVAELGLDLPRSGSAKNLEAALKLLDEIDLPVMVRPSFILGGSGSGLAHTHEEYIALCQNAFALDSQQELLIDEALIGWKEFEMEVVRDKQDNCIIVCAIENVDPLGIHTGDSITVAPAQTLTDKEYQKMRSASFAILRAIGIDTGGSNVQFAVNPMDGRMVVIEMNPRVSRSSALASKATGFPIAKVAAKLAIGYTLPELSSDMTGGQVPASFEPTLDYVVVKIPRFNFEKFAACEAKLGTQMRSVGEAMAIGRTFSEALLKGMRSMEIATYPLWDHQEMVKKQLCTAGPYRLWAVFAAFRLGMSCAEVQSYTGIDLWFLYQILELVLAEQSLADKTLETMGKDELYFYKQMGFSDQQLGQCLKVSSAAVAQQRKAMGVIPIYKRVDSCAAEFTTAISYLYGTYEEECEAHPSDNPKIMILGSGPSRIGQGIEFDYCCVHAIQALKEMGYETLIINCNPETVSTDYDCADKLYLSPLTAEDIMAIVDLEEPQAVLVQYGGQTPLNLAIALAQAGVPLAGMSAQLIAQTEDRTQFQSFLKDLGLKQPDNRTSDSFACALNCAQEIGYPLIVRPSYVLGGRAMAIVHEQQALDKCLQEAFQASQGKSVLIEHFLGAAIEVDIDAICDGETVFIPAIMEHIEPAGVHSGDSACVLPPVHLNEQTQQELRKQTEKIALALNIVGLINIQFAIQGEVIYVLEVNPRASRTVPFLSKVTGIDLVKVATRCLMGISLKDQGYLKAPEFTCYAVKEAVLPFAKFDHADCLLGPEMKSTGEVMGIGNTFAEAYAKAQIAAGHSLPRPETCALVSMASLNDHDTAKLASTLKSLPLKLAALPMTAEHLMQQGIDCTAMSCSAVAEKAAAGEVGLIVTLGKEPDDFQEGYALRRLALMQRICHVTTLSSAVCMANVMQRDEPYSLQSLNLLTTQPSLKH